MAHKPIIDKKRLGWLDRVEVGPHHQGLLYKNRKCEDTLSANEVMPWWDLSRAGYDLYLLDCRPHIIQWRVDLPAKNRKDQFPLTIEFGYQIIAGDRFVDSGFTDTELLIEQKLKLELRRITRDYDLDQYGEIVTAVEEALEESDFFETYGLQLVPDSIDVVLTFSDEELARISGKILPQQIHRQAELPSKENLYPFEADIVFKYRVTNKEMFAKAINDAVEWLWQELLQCARAVTADFPVNQLQTAQDRIREKFKAQHFASDGVEAMSVFVTLSLGEKARRHAEDLDAISRGAETDTLSDERRIAHLERMIAFFERYLPADMHITALGMSDEQVTIREAIERLDQRRQEQLSAQMSMFQDLLKKNAFPETSQERLAEALADFIAAPALRDEVYFGTSKKRLATDKLDNEAAAAEDESDTADDQVTEGGGDESESQVIVDNDDSPGPSEAAEDSPTEEQRNEDENT